MSLAFAMLAVLRDGPLHGYALRTVLGERIGGFWPVNQGQVYATLGRLARDGWVVASRDEEHSPSDGRRTFAIAPAGQRALERWLDRADGATAHGGPGFDDWIARLAVAERRGDRERLRALLEAQRRRCESLARVCAQRLDPGPSRLADRAAAEILAAELAWLDVARRVLLSPAERET